MRRLEVIANRLNIRSGPGKEYPVWDVVALEDILTVADSGWVSVEMQDGSVGWVSAALVADYDGPVAEESPDEAVVKGPEGEPPWITWAKAQLWQAEAPGAKDNPTIVSWFKESSLPQSLWHDATAWCAIFVNAALALTGQPHLHSALAVDWLEYGTPVDLPQLGDVVVFQWAGGGHHVALML